MTVLRYTRVLVGTDKALIGPLDELRSTEAIFRTSFGRSGAESLKRYGAVEADTRTLLSDGSFDAPGLGHGHVRRRAVACPPLGRGNDACRKGSPRRADRYRMALRSLFARPPSPPRR